MVNLFHLSFRKKRNKNKNNYKLMKLPINLIMIKDSNIKTLIQIIIIIIKWNNLLKLILKNLNKIIKFLL